MGCDIHMYVEHKRNGEWVAVPPPPENRPDWWAGYLDEHTASCILGGDTISAYKWYVQANYWVFGALAGVRSSHPQRIDHPRGFPPGTSEFVNNERRLFGETDAHSSSWVSIEEAEAVTDWGESKMVEMLAAIREWYPGETRMVFFFDN